LKTSEEAKCVPNNTCEYEYKTPSATVTNIATAYSTQDGEWQTTVTGTGIGGSCANTEFKVYGRKQTCKTLSATSVVFTLDNLVNSTIGGMTLYLEEGTPEGAKAVLDTSMTITPKMHSISPKFGAAGGTLLRVNAPGVGTSSSVTLGFANGT
jgi:hypothetical protein